jgi:hypothetical protein
MLGSLSRIFRFAVRRVPWNLTSRQLVAAAIPVQDKLADCCAAWRPRGWTQAAVPSPDLRGGNLASAWHDPYTRIGYWAEYWRRCMNVLAGGSVAKLLSIFVLSSALAFSGSCSAPQAVSRPQFTAMPLLGQGGEEANYVTILGPVTGTGSKTFTIMARTGISAWLGCIGKGLVWLRSPAGSFAAACDDGGVWGGGQTQPTHLRAGQKITVRVIAALTTRWELRIDGTPQAS